MGELYRLVVLTRRIGVVIVAMLFLMIGFLGGRFSNPARPAAFESQRATSQVPRTSQARDR